MILLCNISSFCGLSRVNVCVCVLDSEAFLLFESLFYCLNGC